jgi:hypothetical protein
LTGEAAGRELAGADHLHLYALQAAAQQQAWADCGVTAGWAGGELTLVDHPLHQASGTLRYMISYMIYNNYDIAYDIICLVMSMIS